MKYTREKLIEICEKSFLSQTKWDNERIAARIIELGKCYALLKTDCDFEVHYEFDMDGNRKNPESVQVKFWVKDFHWFKGYDHDKRGFNSRYYNFDVPSE